MATPPFASCSSTTINSMQMRVTMKMARLDFAAYKGHNDVKTLMARKANVNAADVAVTVP